MSGTEWMVVIGGAGAIALVNWYFFFAQGPTSGATTQAAQPATTTSAARAGHDAPAGE